MYSTFALLGEVGWFPTLCLGQLTSYHLSPRMKSPHKSMRKLFSLAIDTTLHHNREPPHIRQHTTSVVHSYASTLASSYNGVYSPAGPSWDNDVCNDDVGYLEDCMPAGVGSKADDI